MKMTYGEQLRHPNWQRKRADVLARADFKCESCGDTETTLHVHHRRYVKGRMAWEYDSDELLALCEVCHSEDHRHGQLLNRVLAGMDYGGISDKQIAASLVGGFLAAIGRLSDDETVQELFDDPNPNFFVLGVFAGALGLKNLALSVATHRDHLHGQSKWVDAVIDHFQLSKAGSDK